MTDRVTITQASITCAIRSATVQSWFDMHSFALRQGESPHSFDPSTSSGEPCFRTGSISPLGRPLRNSLSIATQGTRIDAIQAGPPPLDSGPVSSTGQAFRRYDDVGWLGRHFHGNRSCRLRPAHQGMKMAPPSPVRVDDSSRGLDSGVRRNDGCGRLTSISYQ